jgi:hypothetical protein
MPVVDLIALCICIPRLVTLALCPLGGSTLYASKSCGRASLALAFENALQIAQYFQQYSLLSQSMKSECAELLQNLERTLFLHSEYIVNVTGNDVCTEDSCSVQSCDDVWDAYSAYFADVKSIARRQWTAFNIPCMVVGLCVVAFVCILLMFFLDVDLRKVISSRRSVIFFNLAFPFFFNDKESLYCQILLAGAVFSIVSAFSNSFIVEEMYIHYYIPQSAMMLGVVTLLTSGPELNVEKLISSICAVASLRLLIAFNGLFTHG